MKLVSIPGDKYSDYRYNVIFGAYKWDPQVGDNNTIAKHAVLMGRETAERLGEWSEQLAKETERMEEALISKLHLAKELGLPKSVYKTLSRLHTYKRERHVRLMRFDFHPIDAEPGWAISEVNSDVPGGIAEASVFPRIACEYFDGYEPYADTAASIYEAFKLKIPQGGTAAFIHCTAYSDDRQVMQCLSDYFEARGYNTLFAAPDHVKWVDNKAVCLLKGQEGKAIDGIVRFFPLEWFVNLPRSADWRGFYDTETPSCNHPVAMLTQSKRLPLIWDKLDAGLPAWKLLLPETKCPKSHAGGNGWILKPALGRVGENITIEGAEPEKKIRKIRKAARRYPKDWVAQRMFNSRPLTAEDGTQYHLCIGSFTVNGKHAGFYGRVSEHARIDASAKDIPILVSKLNPN